MRPPIVQDSAARDLLPGTHLLDSSYVDADSLVTAQQDQVDVVGLPFGSYSWQHKIAHGYDLQAFSWIGRLTRPVVPEGIRVPNGPQATMSPAIRCFGPALTGPPVAPVPPITYARPPKMRHAKSPSAPKPTTKRSRLRDSVKRRPRSTQYALRSGVERSLSQGIRRFDLRQSRYHGLARTHLQQLLTATAMNIARVLAWLKGELVGERRRTPGYFAQLAPHPLSRQAVIG